MEDVEEEVAQRDAEVAELTEEVARLQEQAAVLKSDQEQKQAYLHVQVRSQADWLSEVTGKVFENQIRLAVVSIMDTTCLPLIPGCLFDPRQFGPLTLPDVFGPSSASNQRVI